MRSKVWFKPPTDPIILEIIEEAWTITSESEEVSVNEMRHKGAIFWMVIRTKQHHQDIPCTIEGNQKCTGAAPIFNSKDIRIRVEGWKVTKISAEALPRMVMDPRAWIKKYFKADSEE